MKGENEFQGSRLRIARIFNGLTLAELGEKVSVSRQYLQRLEVNSGIAPSKDLLNALSAALSFNSDFFFEYMMPEIREENCHFRRLQTTPAALRQRALSYGTIFSWLVDFLETRLVFPKVNIPSIHATDRESIEKAAETCRLHWGLRLDAPIDNVTRALERAGVIITTFSGVSSKIDAFSFVNDRPIIVRSLDKQSSSRARFDLAHECGHLVMHGGLDTGDVNTEAEANNFASAFLLPRLTFIREFPRMNERIDWMALYGMKARWKVSVQAIIRRAYDLGLLNAIQYRNANIYISRNGLRKQELHEPPEETPELIPSALKVLADTKGIYMQDVANSLGVDLNVLNEIGIDITQNVATNNIKSNIVSIDSKRNS